MLNVNQTATLTGINPRMTLVFKDGTEENIVEVSIDSWRIEGDFFVFESHEGDQIHYFFRADLMRFMTYYV